jgi:hypothetical protein
MEGQPDVPRDIDQLWFDNLYKLNSKYTPTYECMNGFVNDIILYRNKWIQEITSWMNGEEQSISPLPMRNQIKNKQCKIKKIHREYQKLDNEYSAIDERLLDLTDQCGKMKIGLCLYSRNLFEGLRSKQLKIWRQRKEQSTAYNIEVTKLYHLFTEQRAEIIKLLNVPADMYCDIVTEKEKKEKEEELRRDPSREEYERAKEERELEEIEKAEEYYKCIEREREDAFNLYDYDSEEDSLGWSYEDRYGYTEYDARGEW